jgi:hypothetical protein
MSLRSTVGRSVGPPRAPWRWILVAIAMMLSACSPAGAGPGALGESPLGRSASSAGVCQAISALPDTSAAERAFTNVAHDALHGLAAEPRLSRAMSARILEAMQKVEDDFSRSPDAAVLSADLTDLHTSADSALQALGEEVPGCPA